MKSRNAQGIRPPAFVLAMVLLGGCNMTAPMHVWRNGEVPHDRPVRIAVAPVGGPESAALRLQSALQATTPSNKQIVAVLHPDALTNLGGIQLVSYDGQPSDMAMLGAARRASIDYVLQGFIIQQDLDVPPPEPRSRFQFFKPKEHVESIAVKWCVMDVATGERVKEQFIALNRNDADRLYPDLAYIAASGDARVVAAAARQSWSLIAPTTQTTEALLALPWFMPGSSQIRKGNGYARQGRWDLAEQEWQEAAHLHSWNKAAWTNLSLASVAHEDFSLARDRLKHADTFWPGDSTSPTLAWIERQQRAYHATFHLPPPSSGWTLPDPPKAVRPDQVEAVPAKDLQDAPWWTFVPFL